MGEETERGRDKERETPREPGREREREGAVRGRQGQADPGTANPRGGKRGRERTGGRRQTEPPGT